LIARPQELVALITTARHRPNFGIQFSVAQAQSYVAPLLPKLSLDDVVFLIQTKQPVIRK
jgi:hypothetical protein